MQAIDTKTIERPAYMSTTSKALSLLNLFTQSQLELRLSDITRLSGMDKATVYRHLTALKMAGLLEQTEPEKLYRIGPEVLRLANIRETSVPMLEAAQRVLKSLSDSIHETTHMSLLKNDSLVTVAHSYSKTHATGVMIGDNDSHPLHATSSGLCVLAHAPQTLIDTILGGELTAYTAKTVTDPAEVRALLDQVRNKGYAESVGGFEANLHSFAAPVFNAKTNVIGAISITAPADRVDERNKSTFTQFLMKAATQLTRQIGGMPSKTFSESTAA